MKAWKYKEGYFYGNLEEVKRDIILFEYPNLISRMFNRKGLLKTLEETNLIKRVPFLDNKQKQGSINDWERQVQQSKDRVVHLNKILKDFSSLTLDELNRLPLELIDSTSNTSDINKEKREEIKVNKIVGIERFSKYNTWGEIFIDFLNGASNPSLKVEKKLDRLVSVYIEDPKEFNKIFINPIASDFPYASYDSALDKYYITSGGSHRAFLARMLNLDTIIANVSPVISIEQAKLMYH